MSVLEGARPAPGARAPRAGGPWCVQSREGVVEHAISHRAQPGRKMRGPGASGGGGRVRHVERCRADERGEGREGERADGSGQELEEATQGAPVCPGVRLRMLLSRSLQPDATALSVRNPQDGHLQVHSVRIR
jgi:hypothetical protein